MKFLVLIYTIFSIVLSKTPEEWKTRVIYQVLTDRFNNQDPSKTCTNLQSDCGGTFNGIKSKLDYITGMGFNAIWISPIFENYENAYHGYWISNYFKISPIFGTEQDLKDLIDECHKRDVWVMLDIVCNHVGPVGFNFSLINPFNNSQYYHNYCIITQQDFNDNNVYEIQHCRLDDLPDLKQENNYVRTFLLNWAKETVENYNFDGLRIDTVPEVPSWFWTQFNQSVGVYTMGEVFNGNPQYVGAYQGVLDATLNYPLFYVFRNTFQQGQSLYEMQNLLSQNKQYFKDVTILGNFVDNQDNTRFLYGNGNVQFFKNALIFSIFTEGIPIVYYGDEQEFNGGNDPYNRETLWPYYNTNSDLYLMLQRFIRVRQENQLWNLNQVQSYADNNFYAFSRGDILFATFTNSMNTQIRTITYHPFKDNTLLCSVDNENDCFRVENGQFQIQLDSGEFKIYLVKN